MSLDLHHVHVFAVNIDATVEWWCQHMCAKVIFDNELAGSRNVFLAVGTGRLHIYDQTPRDRGRGSIHHVGIKVGNLHDVWRRLQAQGVTSPLYPDLYADMRMWDYRDGERGSDYPPGPVLPELVRAGCFVFLGKRRPVAAVDYDAILADFDRLLSLYRFVESGGREPREPAAGNGFQFHAGCTEKASATTASLAERELNANLRHTLLQAALCDHLIKKYGADNVADEHASGLGTKIDVVLRHSANEFWYYEIKTALSPRACIREALGQVLEYAYWPGAYEAARLIICGESALDHDGAFYLKRLQTRFQIPLAYEQIAVQ